MKILFDVSKYENTSRIVEEVLKIIMLIKLNILFIIFSVGFLLSCRFFLSIYIKPLLNLFPESATAYDTRVQAVLYLSHRKQ